MSLETFKNYSQEGRIVNIRLLLALVCMLLLTAVLISRLVYLQVDQHDDLATLSDENRIHLRPLPPTRGLIYDTHGELLAYNRPSFLLVVVPERVDSMDHTLAALQELIALDDSDIKKFRDRVRRRRPFEEVPLKYNLTEDEIARIAVNQFRLSGVEVSARLIRYYPFGKDFAHSVGYVGRINERELKSVDASRYSGTDTIGKIGLEKYYEPILMGKPGYQEVESNARGRVLRVLKEVPPEPGQNLDLYLDAELQEAAVKALGNKRGAVVAIDPQTGGVLALVSTPGFDPNLFVTGIDSPTYSALRDDINRPLYNRATLGEYPPASVLKPVMALALLENNIVTPSDRVFDPGFYRLPGNEHKYRNWKRQGHGWVNLKKAIVVSNDTYFYAQANKLGIDNMHSFVSRFGLGETSELDLGEVRPGLLPSRIWKKALYNQPWYPGETIIAIIGQGYMLSTPMQLAEAIMMIANRGKYIKPRLAKNEPLNDDSSDMSSNLVEKRPESRDVKLQNDAYWDLVIDALDDVVSDQTGTAYWRIGRKRKYDIAGKTGTAQVVSIPQGEKYDAEKLKEFQRDHSWFAGFAPTRNPKIVVAAILENNKGSANLVRDVMDAYLLRPGMMDDKKVAEKSDAVKSSQGENG
ncbi:penicillin-binding protein 2 [Spongorhabdus nitratireducens]